MKIPVTSASGTYTTSQVAKIIEIHPNTVRLYEELDLISKPERKANGYRIFTDLHLTQFKIARLAFEVEIMQNGLRAQAINIVKNCARCEFDSALEQTTIYFKMLEEEKKNAEKAIQIVEEILSGDYPESSDICLTRIQAAQYLHVTIDTLRNWELNGLLTVKRKKNGYRIYTEEDIRRLTIIKSLRCANYSLSAILRMLYVLSGNPEADVKEAIETSQEDEDIITACDQLITSLNHAKVNAEKIYKYLEELKQ